MAMFSFKIAVGWGQTDPPNVEDIITDAPTILFDQLVPLTGNVRKQALDATIHRAGRRNIAWLWDHITQADKVILLHTIFPNNENSKQVTISTLDEDGSYTLYNATAERPRPQEHYSLWIGGDIRDFTLPLWDLVYLDLSYDDSYDNSFAG